MNIVSTRCNPFQTLGEWKNGHALANALSNQDDVLFITGEGIFQLKIEKTVVKNLKHRIPYMLYVKLASYLQNN